MVYIVGLILFFVSIAIGFDLPDLDLRVGFLMHRSILTHGWLVPFAFFWVARRRSFIPLRLVALGMSLAFAIHLSFDLFPAAWRGFALIHIPLLGRAGSLFSWLWIAISIVVCFGLALRLIQTVFDVWIGMIGLLGSFVFYASGESMFFGLPLITLIGAWCVAVLYFRTVARPRNV